MNQGNSIPDWRAERDNPWHDLGGRLSDPVEDDTAERATARIDLGGVAIRTPEQDARISELVEAAHAASDALKIANGMDPVHVAALRRAHNERRLRRA